jgi:protein-tyrosine-phosphatase
MSAPPFVLFVCLHGAAKSVIASQYFRRLAAERGINAITDAAGTEPDAEIPPGVVRRLRGDGIEVGALRPRAVTRADVERAARVVAFGCDLTDVAPPGASIERWDDVPAVSDDYDRARDVIVARVRTLVDGLRST